MPYTRNSSQIHCLIHRQARTFSKQGFSDKLDPEGSCCLLPGIRTPGSFKKSLNLLTQSVSWSCGHPPIHNRDTRQRESVKTALLLWETLSCLLPIRWIKRQRRWWHEKGLTPLGRHGKKRKLPDHCLLRHSNTTHLKNAVAVN